MDKDCFENSSHRKLLFALLGIGYLLLMFGNGVVSLTHPDEVFYVQTAKEMVGHHSWMTPMIFDAPQFEKPILFFWLLAPLVKFFGPTPFVARFWPASFAIAGLGITYWLAWMLFGRKRLAFLSGVVLGSSFIYLALARAVLTDMVFSIWVVMAIAFFYWGYQSSRRRTAAIFLFWGITALAVLTKGILGFTFPVAAVLIFIAYRKDWTLLKHKAVWWGFLLFVVLALPWHCLMYRWYGQTFIHEYFYNVHINRLISAEHPKLDHWYFYLGVMLIGVLPWSFFWPPAIGSIYKQFREKAAARDGLVFLFSWIAAVFVFIEPAHSKLASYVFPVFPALAILLAYYFDGAVSKNVPQKGLPALSGCGYVSAGCFLVLAVGAIVAGHIYQAMVPDKGPVYLLVLFLVFIAGLIFVFNSRRAYVKMLFTYPLVTFSFLVVLLLAKPYAEPWISCKGISETFKTIDHSDSTVLTSKFYVRGVRFYTDRKMAVIDINGEGFFSPHPIPFLNTDEKVLAFLATQPVTYAIVKKGNVKDLKRIVAGHPFRLAELKNEGGKYILRIEKI